MEMDSGHHSSANSGNTFVFSNTIQAILFSGWEATNEVEYWTAIGVVFIAALYTEFLLLCKRKVSSHILGKGTRHMYSRYRFKGFVSLFYVLHLWFHYMLMLVVMTFNAGLILSVLSGAGLGYFLFVAEPVYKHKDNCLPVRDTLIALEEMNDSTHPHWLSEKADISANKLSSASTSSDDADACGNC
eukprot:TRINITY_DN4698_c0_g1_i1.p1 TRINITY_DN4698_c0_g1~~TRINITY_DN4698_c0_g1_i1.p1  ORF type:complete len:199 (+),score=39.38 TRINITY_DN4698_c0_g1_i1:38-598(+)